MTRTAWFDGPTPRILAHRGFTRRAPDSSLTAFQDALDAGATHLETDVRATSDGVAVLVHDPRIGSTEHADRIADLTLAQVRVRLPEALTLADALRALPRARFNLDLKARSAVLPVVRDIRAAGASDRLLVTSFARRRARPVARALGSVATSPSAAPVAVGMLAAAVHLGALLRPVVRGFDAVQVPERVLGVRLDSPAVVGRLHRAAVEVHVWVVDDPERMRELVAAGVDGIVTDRTDLAVAALH